MYTCKHESLSSCVPKKPAIQWGKRDIRHHKGYKEYDVTLCDIMCQIRYRRRDHMLRRLIRDRDSYDASTIAATMAFN